MAWWSFFSPVFWLWFLVFSGLAYAFPLISMGKFSRWCSLGLFLLKVAGALLVWYVYTFYYPNLSKADIYRFFYDGITLHGFVDSQPGLFLKNMVGLGRDFEHHGQYFDHMANWVHPHGNTMYNDNRLVIRFHALIAFFTDKQMTTHSLWFAFMAWLGTGWLARATGSFFKVSSAHVALPLFLIPGLLLWVGPPLKETLLVLFAAVLFAGFARLKQDAGAVWGWIAIGLATWLLLLTKFYVAALLLPTTGLFLFTYWIKRPQLYLPFLGALLLALVVYDLSTDSVDLVHSIYFKQQNFLNLALSEQSGSLIQQDYLENSLSGLMQALPQAWLNAFFEPLPSRWSWRNLPALGDNLWFWGLLIWGSLKAPGAWTKPMLWYFLTMALLFFAILGWTTPVLGALFRYKVPLWFVAAPVLMKWISTGELTWRK